MSFEQEKPNKKVKLFAENLHIHHVFMIHATRDFLNAYVLL